MDKSMFDIIDIDVVTGGTVHEHVTTFDFYRYFDIGSEEMIAYLDNRDSYWKSRKTAATYSTNCPIKQIGDYAHLHERGFHFYGSATSWEQRLGHLSLENVKEDLTCRVSPQGYENFLKRIGHHPEVHSGSDERYICAYIVSEKEFSTPVLRENLSGKIPGYMIPSYFVSLPSLPLTPVGKIDKRALPLPDRSRSRLKSTYVAPESGLEKTITQVWQEVLQVDKVGLEDNFFDLGGDSLDIVRVSGKLKTVLSREVPVVMIFNFPTVGLLAGNLKPEKDGSKPGVNVKKRRYEEREKGKNRLKARVRRMAGTR
jgi:acyl carrier protein